MGTGRFIRFVWLLLLLGVSFKPVLGQQWAIDFQGRDFFELRDSLRNYYDSLATAGDSSAFHEGGPYSRYKRWSEFWSLRLKAGTNFRDYFNAEAVARAAMQSRSAGNTDPWYEIGPKDKPTLGENNIGQGSQPGIGPSISSPSATWMRTRCFAGLVSAGFGTPEMKDCNGSTEGVMVELGNGPVADQQYSKLAMRPLGMPRIRATSFTPAPSCAAPTTVQPGK